MVDGERAHPGNSTDDSGQAGIHHARPARPDRARPAAPEPLSQEVLGDLKLALTEACTNSVRHAYAGGQGSVQILYELHSDRLVVEVTDDGEGFEPPSQPSEAFDGHELSEGGLGIAIIEALADELEIREREQGGSSLRFVKLL